MEFIYLTNVHSALFSHIFTISHFFTISTLYCSSYCFFIHIRIFGFWLLHPSRREKKTEREMEMECETI